MMSNQHKACAGCDAVLPLSAFSLSRHGTPKARCKSCYSAAARAWRDDPDNKRRQAQYDAARYATPSGKAERDERVREFNARKRLDTEYEHFMSKFATQEAEGQ